MRNRWRVMPTDDQFKEQAHSIALQCKHSLHGACVVCVTFALQQADENAREEERERCAMLHESVDVACDHERQSKSPGAGAMGAVIAYRDLIRTGGK